LVRASKKQIKIEVDLLLKSAGYLTVEIEGKVRREKKSWKIIYNHVLNKGKIYTYVQIYFSFVKFDLISLGIYYFFYLFI